MGAFQGKKRLDRLKKIFCVFDNINAAKPANNEKRSVYAPD
jgi:hypothetical protein